MSQLGVTIKQPIILKVQKVSAADMLKAIYDPRNIQKDVFNIDNLTDGTAFKVMTAAERTKLAGIQTGAQVNAVTSVAGRTGAVTLSSSDVSEGTRLYYTDTRVDNRIGVQKASPNGLATLDSAGLLPTSQLPPLSINDTFVVASQAAMLALTAQRGDTAKRTDTGEVFILGSEPASTLANWVRLSADFSAAVDSVNGATGAVSLTTTNIPEGTSLYYTTARFDTRLASKTTADLAEGANLYYTDARVASSVAANTGLVHRTGTELINGPKTFGNAVVVGGDNLQARRLVSPQVPTVTQAGTPGTTSYRYKVIAVNQSGSDAPAQGQTITNTGAATLNTTDYNVVTWTTSFLTDVPAQYRVLRSTDGGASYQLLTTVTHPTLSINDQGQYTPSAYTEAIYGPGSKLILGDGSAAGPTLVKTGGTHILIGDSAVILGNELRFNGSMTGSAPWFGGTVGLVATGNDIRIASNGATTTKLNTLDDGSGKLTAVNMQMTAGAAAGRVIGSDASGNFTWITTPSDPLATISAPGLIQLAGDLGGTATAPTIKNALRAYDIANYGGVADGREVNDATMTNGSAVVTSATAAFVAGDVGKIFVVWNGLAGLKTLYGTIVSVQSGTQATLSAVATVDVTAGKLRWGTNNTPALNAIRNLTQNANGGYTIYAQRGNYAYLGFDSQQKENINVLGDGSGQTNFWLMTGTTGFGFGNASTSTRSYYNFGIRGFTLDMNFISHGFLYGIVFGGTRNVFGQDVFILNTGKAPSKNHLFIGVTGGSSSLWCRDGLFIGCHFDGNTSSYESVLTAQAYNIKFFACDFDNCQGPYGLLQYGTINLTAQGCRFANGSDVRASGRPMRVLGNDFYKSKMVITGSYGTIVQGNEFDGGSYTNEFGNSGVQMQAYISGDQEIGWDSPPAPFQISCQNIVIEGNHFTHCSSSSISAGYTTGTQGGNTITVFDVTDVTIANNVIEYTLWQGISLVAKRATIAYNKISNSGQLLSGPTRFNMLLALENGLIVGNRSFDDQASPTATRDFYIDNGLAGGLIPTMNIKFRDNEFEINGKPRYYSGGSFTDTKPSNIIISGTGNKGINPDLMVDKGTTSGAVTFDRAQGHTAMITLNGNATFTLTSGSMPGDLLTLSVSQDATGGRTITWAGSNIKWPSGSAPNVSTAPGTYNIFQFRNDGTNWVEVGRVPVDASSTTLGRVQLTNDFGGSASAPTVVATHLTSALPVNQGGTGAGTLTGILKGNGTGAVTGSATTSDLTEGTNLYYTNARADARIAAQAGVAGGLAQLDGTGKVPSGQLPAYVDDVLEYANLAALPATGETGKIYVTLDTNYEYRWSGSVYIRLVASPGSTDAVPEGSTNLYYTDARVAAAPAVVAKANKGANSDITSLSGLTTPLSLAQGGVGSATAGGARTNLGLVIGTDVQAYSANTTLLGNTTTGTGAIVLTTSPTIVTPTIASFVNANHNHTNAAGGGQLTDAALSAAVSIAKGGTGQVTASAGFNALSPITTIGDLIVGATGGASTRLASGSATQILIGGTSPSWGTLNVSTMVTGVLPVANGGTGSASQNFVDVSSTQNAIGGPKTWLATQTISSTAPKQVWYETDAAADAKRWDFVADGQIFYGRTGNDADSSNSAWIQVTRSLGVTLPGALTIGTPLAVGSGGTGSATKNFLDITGGSQNVLGLKTFYNTINAGGASILTAYLKSPLSSQITVTNQGAAGSTTYYYRVIGVSNDGFDAFNGGTVNTATGNATLSGTNFNRITWTTAFLTYAPASYKILRSTDNITFLQIGTTTSLTFDDTGQTGSGYTAPFHSPGSQFGLGDGTLTSPTFMKDTGFHLYLGDSPVIQGAEIYFGGSYSGSAPWYGGWPAITSPSTNNVRIAQNGATTTKNNTLDDGSGSMNIIGAFSLTVTATQTGNYSIGSTATFVPFNIAAAATATLPDATAFPGREIEIILISTGFTLTIATVSSQTINGASTASLATQYKYIRVKSVSGNWLIMGNN